MTRTAVALAAAVTEAGGEPLVLPRERDDAAAIERALTDAARRADLIVTSGGVSVGEHDYVRAVLEQRGGLDFWRIAVQPGKPLAVGELGSTTVIGLPGNPVSALVTFELFVRPFIRSMLGLAGDGRLRVRARPEARIEKDPARRAFLRVNVWEQDGALRARSAGGQLSSQLRPMADANALLVVPEGEPAAETDREYEAIVIEALAMKPSHLDDEGAPRMVDVGAKPVTARRAVAAATVRMRPDVLATLVDAGGPKGDAFVTARLAGIGAAKRTAELIPLCHPLPLDRVDVELDAGRCRRGRDDPDRGAGDRPHRRRDGGAHGGQRRGTDPV